jgi:putative ABC transport system permease protein
MSDTKRAVSGIIFLFSKIFIGLISIVFLMTIPVCYLWLTEWIGNFDVKTELSVWNFPGPFIFTLFITLPIGFIVGKTASVSRADNLRNE